MFQSSLRTLTVFAVLSVTVSLAMATTPFVLPEMPIWPLIVANWLLFITVTVLAGGGVSLLRRHHTITRTDHNIWRVTILAFVGCGYIALANGATLI